MARPAPDVGHLFFDLDGTLTNPAEGITRCIAFALERLGENPPPLASLTRYIGPPLGVAFAELLSQPSEDRVAAAIAAYRERYGSTGIHECEIVPGVPELLRELTASGRYRLFVVTSKPTVYAEQVIEHFRLGPHFDAIYGPPLDMKGADKHALIARTLVGEGIAATDAWMIGDREHDVIGAVGNGVASVGVRWGFGSLDELRAAGATHIVSSPEELGRLTLGSHDPLDPPPLRRRPRTITRAVDAGCARAEESMTLSQRIDLPDGGQVDLGFEPDELTVRAPGGVARHFEDHPLLADEGRVHAVPHASGDRALIGRLRSERLFLLRLPECDLDPVPLGDRLPRVEQLVLVTSGALFLALTESGIYAIDGEGRERWRIDGTTYDWRYVGDQGGDVWLSDTNGNLLGFDARTGREKAI